MSGATRRDKIRNEEKMVEIYNELKMVWACEKKTNRSPRPRPQLRELNRWRIVPQLDGEEENSR